MSKLFMLSESGWKHHPNYNIQLLVLISTIKVQLSDGNKSSFCFQAQYNNMTN